MALIENNLDYVSFIYHAKHWENKLPVQSNLHHIDALAELLILQNQHENDAIFPFLMEYHDGQFIITERPMSPYEGDIKEFASLMTKEMDANQHKGTKDYWIRCDPRLLVNDLCYHASKMAAAIKEKDDSGVLEFAADCGNLAMMAMLSYQSKLFHRNRDRESISDSDDDDDYGHDPVGS